MPPLCVAGIGLGLQDDVGASVEQVISIGIGNQVSTGALLLFSANLIGITVSASLVFLWQNYGRWRKAATSLASLAILLAVVSGPLSGSMGEFILEKQIDSQIAKLWQRYPQYREVIQLKNLRVQSVHNKGVTIDFQLYAPAALLEEKFLDRLNAELIQVLQNNGPGFAGQDWGDGRMSVRFMAAAAPAGGAAAPPELRGAPGSPPPEWPGAGC